MEIIYTKIEQLPDISGLIRTYLGVEKKINNKKNKNINSKILTKNEMFSINDDYETCIQNTNLCVVSNSYTPIQKNIRGVDQALFLQFLDLDVFSKTHLHEFIRNYGYLINNQNNKKSSFFATIKPIVAEKDFETYKNSGRVYYEPLSIWLLLQNKLSNLVSLWRLLAVGGNTDLEKLYTDQNFITKGKKFFYSNNFLKDWSNFFYRSKSLDLRGLNFIPKDFSFTDLVPFNYNPKIDLTSDLKNHKETILGGGRLFTDPNFNTHIANEILVTQLNELQNFFRPAIEVGGKVSFSPLVATHRFPFSQNIHCNSLFSAILNQLIEAIREKQDFIRCNQCRKWTLKVKVRKEKRLYCCDGCRSKANRNRKSLDTYIALKVFKKYKNLSHYVKSFLDETFGKKNKDPTSFFYKDNQNKNLADFLHDLVWNIMLNYDANCSEETMANHLGIQREFLGDLSFLKNYAKGSDLFITNPYFDWDN